LEINKLYIPSLLLLDSIFVLAGKFHVFIIDSALRLETNATNDKLQTVGAHLASA
jgi:ABC-type enterochelin transport system permease subunit